MPNFNFCNIHDLTAFREMTDAEIKGAIKTLKKAIAEQPEKFIIEGMNPCEQYAYTSSSSLAGIYFPNSAITLKNLTAYDVTALCMTKDGHITLVLSLNDKGEERAKKFPSLYADYMAVSLDYIIHDVEEVAIREKLQKAMNEQLEELEMLKRRKLVTKKDGKPFANLAQNYAKESGFGVGRDFQGCVNEVHFQGFVAAKWVSVKVWLPQESRSGNPFLEMVETAIKEEEKRLAESIAFYAKQLRVVHKAYLACRNAIAKAKSVLDSIPEAMSEDGHWHSSLGYALQDYMKAHL